jgi:outer membrane protein assembly factor BamB
MVIDDGIVYVADVENILALDADSGEVEWTFPEQPGGEGGPFFTVTMLPGEALFVTSEERGGGGFLAQFSQSRAILRALSLDPNEAAGRRVLWPPFAEAGGAYISGGAVENGLLVIGNSDGNVYAFHVEGNMEPAWTFSTQGRVWAAPLILSDTVYIASLDHRLYALDLDTGRERWAAPFEAGGAIASAPLAMGDRLIVGSFDRKLYAIRQEDGSPVWEFEGANWFWGTPTTDGTTVYGVDVDGNVYALDAETGAHQWDEQVNDLVRLGPLLSQNGNILLVGGNSGTVYGLDSSDGVALWSKPGSGQLGTMVVEGDLVFVSRLYAEERVEAFYTENGRSYWTYSPESEQ